MLEKRTLAIETVGKVGETVTVFGWVHARRDMGKLVFFDLRDMSGRLQVVGVPGELDTDESRANLQSIRTEFVVELTGLVQARGAKQINPDQPTGTVELLAKSLRILSESKTPPFEIDNEERQAGEELRLKYRYLDLRHERMAKNLKLRHNILKSMREFFYNDGFIEVETPILTKGTPEGSREYMVPSRLHAGNFYVLPQSPQQFKQLLMVAGVEKYVQVARCFRDEDQRGDRQPEFTQFDYEMSFVSEEDIMQLTEAALIKMVQEVAPEKRIMQIPFPRITFAESMAKYGNDKPDIRENKNDPNELAFVWVTDMPLFEMGEEEQRLVSAHHPFTMPKDEDRHMLETTPGNARAMAYDVALNGFEIGGGSIRIHERDLQNQIFRILGQSDAQIEAKFGHMLEAFEYGPPPHGGCALGVDRLAAIIANEPNIREVIAFPKTGDARDPMMGAPSPAEDKALAEANIQVSKK
jgi:aspartyl-tRNA synthetase